MIETVDAHFQDEGGRLDRLNSYPFPMLNSVPGSDRDRSRKISRISSRKPLDKLEDSI
jgi:hypothetical protein